MLLFLLATVFVSCVFASGVENSSILEARHGHYHHDHHDHHHDHHDHHHDHHYDHHHYDHHYYPYEESSDGRNRRAITWPPHELRNPNLTIEEILIELEGSVGLNCVSVLVCNGASDSKEYGKFGEQLAELYSGEIPPKDVNIKDLFEPAYILGTRFGGLIQCRTRLQTCKYLDTELNNMLESYYI